MRTPGGADEDDAAESEERFRLLVESVADYAIFMLDPNGRVATWNLGAERIKGYKAAEIIGKHFSVFYPPEDVAAGKTERELEIATRTGRFEEEGWRVKKDGAHFWANVTITAMRGRDGKLIGFAKVTRDLTERRRAEDETRRFRLLVESVKDYAIFILDRGGHVLTWNLGAERIKGYRAQISAGTGRFEEEGWRIRKDGARFWANVVITALRNPDGVLVGFAKVTRDLTDRKEAEETQRALVAERAKREEQSRIQEFQERFLAILGHDLRNPLASIDMGAGILRQLSKDPAAIRILDRMRSSSLRMSRMIEQILDLTRTRLADGLKLDPKPMDLRDLTAHVIEELRVIHPSRLIELRSPPLPGVWDPDRLEQVFSNLIGNALLYGAPEAPVVVVGGIEDGLIWVDVHNDGAPIPAEMQSSLFNPFRRGERESRSSKTTGLGLGLYISREVAIAHGGGINLRSSVTEGTTFRVTLPVTSLLTPTRGKVP